MTVGLVVALAVVSAAVLARRAGAAGRRVEVGWRLSPPAAPVTASTSPDLAARLWSWWSSRPIRRERRLIACLPAALEEVARSVRSGTTLRQALTEAATGPDGWVLRPVVAHTSLGASVGEGLRAWSAEMPRPDVNLAACALGLAADSGGSTAHALDAVAATLRERAAADQDIAVQSAQARLSAVVIGLLPVVFTAWCVLTDDRAARFLLASPAGWACLLAGGALLALGTLWMNRIIRSAR